MWRRRFAKLARPIDRKDVKFACESICITLPTEKACSRLLDLHRDETRFFPLPTTPENWRCSVHLERPLNLMAFVSSDSSYSACSSLLMCVSIAKCAFMFLIFLGFSSRTCSKVFLSRAYQGDLNTMLLFLLKVKRRASFRLKSNKFSLN